MPGRAERISPKETREAMGSNSALLVCAYDEPEKHGHYRPLKGAMPLDEWKARARSLPKNRKIIFYCVCPKEATAARRAEEYEAEGFTNIKVLKGGVDAWKAAGLEVEPAPLNA